MSPRKLWIFFCLLSVTFGYFHHGGGFNQNAIIGEIREIVEHQTADISQWQTVTEDVSFYNNKVFSNKSPSMLFFVAPVYALIHSIADTLSRLIPFDMAGTAYLMFITHLLTFLCSGFWAALMGVLYAKILPRIYPSLTESDTLLLAYLLVMGSFNFPYSASAMVVNFESFWVLMVLYQMVMAREKKTPRHLGTLALSCGCMLLANPFTVLTMPVVYFYVWRDLGIRKMKQLLFFSISAGLPLIPLFIYNHINFDFFLSSNRNHLAPIWTDPNLFMGVFGMPEFGRIKEVFGPGTRSLLTTVPFLYLSIFAFSKRLNRGISFPVPLLPYVGSIFLTFFALLLTFNGWHGGACFGPRYFILVLPLIALITVPFYIRNPLFYSLFVSWSILVMGVASSRGIWLDPENKNPLRTIFKDINGEPSFLWPSFVGAAPSFNIYDLGDLLNIPGYWSLAPLIVLHVLFVVYLMNSRFRFSEKIMSLLETGRRQPPPVHE